MECTTIRAAVIAAINSVGDREGDFWKLKITNEELRNATVRNDLSDSNTMNQVSDKLRMEMCEKYGRSQQVEY